MKRLWVVEYTGTDIPSWKYTPDWEETEVEVVVADVFWVVVREDYLALENIIRDYPNWRITGQPSDGRWIDAGGAEVYIIGAEVIEDEYKAWGFMGFEPQDFDADNWDEVDPDVVRDAIQSF